MLSRTADNLYWLSRYVERAEYLARILDATQRLSALPLAYVGTSNEWESAVATAGCATAFFKLYDEANEANVTDFLAFSMDNSSSIRACFELARSNARAVRTALTMEMWDSINGTWLELKRLFSVGRHFAIGVRAHRLSLGLPGKPAAVAGGRSADLARRDAPITGLLL
jgi:uncharacterized alpha-E superfamily protein